MISFFTVGAFGAITGSGACQDDALDQQGIGGDTAVAGVASSRTQYYDIAGQSVRDYTDAEIAVKNTLLPGWAWKMPERIAVDIRDLDAAKLQAWERIKTSRSQAEMSPFTHDGASYDASKEQISGAVQMALLAQLSGAPFSINWTLRDNTTKAHTAAEMIAVGVALGTHVAVVYDTGRILREQINAAVSNTELDAINWPTV